MDTIKRSTSDTLELALRHKILSEIFGAMAHSEVSPELLADRLDWPFKRLKKILYGNGDLTMREIAAIATVLDFALSFELMDSKAKAAK